MSLAQLSHRFGQLRRHPGYRQNPPVVLWRAAAWSMHCLFGIPARAKFRRWNFELYLPAKWKGGGGTSPYLFREFYEPELVLLERFLKPGMTFVDGGANTGVFTFTAAQLVGPAGCVLAFEPGDRCFAALQESVKLNGCYQVHLQQSALSSEVGVARFYHHDRQENSFSLGSAGGVDFEEVPTTTVDHVADEQKVSKIDFIKLDVEGAEELVLRGGEKSIDRWRPLVLFEVNPEATQRLNLAIEGACQFLLARNYQLFQLDAGGEISPIDRADDFGNVLAVPSEKVESTVRISPIAIDATKKLNPES